MTCDDHILHYTLTNPGPVIMHLALTSQPPLAAAMQGSNAVCHDYFIINNIRIHT